MSSIYATQDGRVLLDIVDKLRNINLIESTIPLPQIVVVGSQSSGKSSVLNAISGLRFPTGDGRCTQFPTEIVLRRENTARTKAWIRHSANATAEHLDDIRKFQETWGKATLADLEAIISTATSILDLSGPKKITAESLVLEVCGPSQEHLTLIDLPGFIASTQVGQDESDIGLVSEIADFYMKKERAIVLAVVTGSHDFENQPILEKMRADAHIRRRTLGVITALDKIDHPSAREQECLSLVQNNLRDFGLGWHLLRNLKPDEVNANRFDQRDEIESAFFKNHPNWVNLQASSWGSQELKKKLSRALKDSIATSLPEIKNEIDQKLKNVEDELASIGQARVTPADLRRFLFGRAKAFENQIEDIMSGAPPNTTYHSANYEVSLRAFIQSQYSLFADEMFDKARLWRIEADDTKALPNLDFTKQVYLGLLPETKKVLGEHILQLILEDVHKNRGKELPNLIHPDWAARIFQRQSKRWFEVAHRHTMVIFGEVSNRVIAAVESIADEDIAGRLLLHIVEPALRRRREALIIKLEELYRPYSSQMRGVQCFSRSYKDKLHFVCPVTGGEHIDQCMNLLRSAETYYDVAVDVFVENVANLAIEINLLEDLPGLMSQEDFIGLSDARLEELGGESPEIAQRRKELLVDQQRFQEARDCILPSVSGRRARSLTSQLASMVIVDSTQTSLLVPPSAGSVVLGTQPATPEKPLAPKGKSRRVKEETPEPSSSRSSSTERGSELSGKASGFSATNTEASSNSSYTSSPPQPYEFGSNKYPTFTFEKSPTRPGAVSGSSTKSRMGEDEIGVKK